MPTPNQEANDKIKARLESLGFEVEVAYAWDGSPQHWPKAPGPDNLRCGGCLNPPSECGYGEYCEENQSPDDYVKAEEGTYDPLSGWFLCDECYIRMGQPSGNIERGESRWVCTPTNLKALIGWT